MEPAKEIDTLLYKLDLLSFLETGQRCFSAYFLTRPLNIIGKAACLGISRTIPEAIDTVCCISTPSTSLELSCNADKGMFCWRVNAEHTCFLPLCHDLIPQHREWGQKLKRLRSASWAPENTLLFDLFF